MFSAFHLKPIPKIPQLLQVEYHAVHSPPKTTAPTSQEVTVVKNRKSNEDVDILSKSTNHSMKLGHELRGVDKSPNVIHLGLKKAPKINSFSDSDKRITVPLLKSEKISNPKYLSYNDTIRQKIRQRAFHYVEHPDFKEGRVYLSFVLDREGRIRDIKVINEKTHANEYLRSVGLRSVRESAPFPPFPKDLTYPELPFNIEIEFKVGP